MKLNLKEIKQVAMLINKMNKHQLERTICFCSQHLEGKNE